MITGADGFIGHNLYHRLRRLNFDVVGTVRTFDHILRRDICNAVRMDLRDSQSISDVMRRVQPDFVIHLGAVSSPNPDYPQDNIHLINVEGTKAICQELKEGNKLLFASSVVVYGDQKNCTESTPFCPTTKYGESKMAAENIIRYYSTNGFKYTNLRLCSVVGPGLTHGAVKDIIEKVKGEECVLYGASPGSKKPYIHINDVCNAFLTFMDVDVPEVNVCQNDNISIKKIARIFDPDKKCKIRWDKSKVWAGDNRVIKCDNSLLKKHLRLEYNSSRESLEALL